MPGGEQVEPACGAQVDEDVLAHGDAKEDAGDGEAVGEELAEARACG